MTKWICDKKGCGCAPCRCEIQGSFEPVYCILKDAKTYPKWEMYDTETKYEHVERRMEQKQEETELPDWCKVGEWVWLDPQKITGANGYEKVTNVDGLGLMFESGLMVCFSHRILQARLRPYNAEEMRGLVGKMASTKRDCGIITGYRSMSFCSPGRFSVLKPLLPLSP